MENAEDVTYSNERKNTDSTSEIHELRQEIYSNIYIRSAAYERF